MARIIGIDLGTTNSAVRFVRKWSYKSNPYKGI